MKKMKTVFMGTPDFAVPCLDALISCTDVILAVTQPDRPRGRGRHITPSPVKMAAEAAEIRVFQPERIKSSEAVEVIGKAAPDLVVVVAFGQILPKEILDIPPLGCVNVHASLLPRYRGAAPMQRCLMNGETETGVTTMLMDEGLDTGDILMSRRVPIAPDMSFGELYDELKGLGGKLLKDTIEKLSSGTAQRIRQDDALSDYAPMITKETGRIDWTRSAREIHDLVRALDPSPGAYASYGEKTLKIWKTRVIDSDESDPPGTVLRRTRDGLAVSTGDGVIEILDVQAPGKKRMRFSDFMRGNGDLCFFTEVSDYGSGHRI